jgi:ElaB/YqjD/DUF883 family membrane-anchored ribosome-binding protein
MSSTGDPAQIREEIAATREELGETVEALAAKTDVKAQAKRKLEGTKASIGEKTEHAWGTVKDASPDSAAAAATQATRTARENPLPVAALGAFAAGFLAGRLSRR